MTTRSSKEKSGGEGNPAALGAPPATQSYEPSHIIQLLVEGQRDINSQFSAAKSDMAALSTKLDRLIQDVEKNDEHLDGIRQKISRFEGVGIASVVLLTVFAGFLWWLVGGQIDRLRDELYRNPPTAAASPATPTSQQ